MSSEISWSSLLDEKIKHLHILYPQTQNLNTLEEIYNFLEIEYYVF